LSAPSLDTLLGQVRDLSKQYLAGGTDAFGAFADLVNLLLRTTVSKGSIGVRLNAGPRPKDRMTVVGAVADENHLVSLNDNNLMRLSIILFREQYKDGHRMKVEQARYQYQCDDIGKRWIFRYDYVREPKDQHPATHLQVRGQLAETVSLHKGMLERVHFPSGRISIESVIRLLIEQFDVPPNAAPETWRRVLAESERIFEDIAHRPLSGPSA